MKIGLKIIAKYDPSIEWFTYANLMHGVGMWKIKFIEQVLKM